VALTIDLAPEEEILLSRQAARQGQEPAAYAAQALRKLIYSPSESYEKFQGQTLAEALARYIGALDNREPNENSGKTLAETLTGRTGCVRSAQPSDMARNSEEEFAKIMDEKKRQGRV